MTDEKIEALKKQLDMYSDEIVKYRKEFLANDGKIEPKEQNILDSIQGMLDKINSKLNNTQNTSVVDSNKDIPKAFQKGFAQLKVATDKLEAKVKELQDADQLQNMKDKLLEQVEKIKANFSSVKSSFENSADHIQKECQEQLDALASTLESIKKQFHNKPVAFNEKVTQAKSQIKAILDRVAAIKAQFS